MAAAPANPHLQGDRRASSRRRTLLAGRICYGSPPLSAPCGVRNLSNAGAMVELEGALPLPSQVQLMIIRDAAIVPARIAWRRGSKIGLAFDQEPFADLVGDQVRALRAILQALAPR